MKFDLKKPCATCPLRANTETTDAEQRRAWGGIGKDDHTMSCHDTVMRDSEGEAVPHADEQHCYGAMMVLTKRGTPNAAMRQAGVVVDVDVCETRRPYETPNVK